MTKRRNDKFVFRIKLTVFGIAKRRKFINSKRYLYFFVKKDKRSPITADRLALIIRDNHPSWNRFVCCARRIVSSTKPPWPIAGSVFTVHEFRWEPEKSSFATAGMVFMRRFVFHRTVLFRVFSLGTRKFTGIDSYTSRTTINVSWTMGICGR